MEAMMFRNSELQKCYWQSFSLQRFIAMPLVIMAIVVLILLANESNRAEVISAVSYQGFYIIVFLWGGYQAANALVQEVKENTWDNQRLSLVSPWDLTVGKLFGSTMYTWYGGVILLALYFFSALQVKGAVPDQVAFSSLLILGAGMLCQATALFSSLIPLRMQAGRDQFHVVGYFILGLIVSGFFYSMGNYLSAPYSYEHDEMKWFGQVISLHYFFLSSMFLLLLWTMWAIYRFMRDALKFKNTPIVWALFVIFCMVYFSGYADDRSYFGSILGAANFYPNNGPFLYAYVVGILAVYLNFFSENLSIIRYRTLFHQWHGKVWKKVGHIVPMWTVSLVLAIAAGIIFVIASPNGSYNTEEITVLVISSLLFLLRDTCILHYFTLNPNGRLPLLAALFYLGVFYLLIPNLVFATGLKIEYVGYIFYPTFFTSGDLQMLLPVVGELFLAAWILKRRYQRIKTQIEQ
jgi:uncharacterized membrane protein